MLRDWMSGGECERFQRPQPTPTNRPRSIWDEAIFMTDTQKHFKQREGLCVLWCERGNVVVLYLKDFVRNGKRVGLGGSDQIRGNSVYLEVKIRAKFDVRCPDAERRCDAGVSDDEAGEVRGLFEVNGLKAKTGEPGAGLAVDVWPRLVRRFDCPPSPAGCHHLRAARVHIAGLHGRCLEEISSLIHIWKSKDQAWVRPVERGIHSYVNPPFLRITSPAQAPCSKMHRSSIPQCWKAVLPTNRHITPDKTSEDPALCTTNSKTKLCPAADQTN